MTIEITFVHFPGTQKTHEAITHYKWRNLEDHTSTGFSDEPSLVAWIDSDGVAYVGKGSQQAKIHPVHSEGIVPHSQTAADGYWLNNLLVLPTF